MKPTFQIIFHTIVFSLTIIHITICSDYFEGTRLWSLFTYVFELLFVIVTFQFLSSRSQLNAIEKLGFLYFAILLFVSYFCGLSSSNIIALIGRSMEISTMLMLFHMHRDDSVPLLLVGACTFSLGVYVNYYLLLEHPLGLLNAEGERYYLLGTNYNQIGTKVVFAFILSALLTDKYKIMMLNLIAVSVIGLTSLLMVGSATSIVSFVWLIAFFIKSWMQKLDINYYIFYSSCFFIVSFQLIVVFLGSQIEITQVGTFLDQIGKDMTFTGRTRLWAHSAEYFWDSPLWGHGFIGPKDYSLTPYFLGDHRNSHNLIYNILHKGGVFLFVVFYQLLKHGYGNVKESIVTKHGFNIVMSAVVFFIMTMFEVFDMFYVFLLVVLMFYYHDIDNAISNYKSNEDTHT